MTITALRDGLSLLGRRLSRIGRSRRGLAVALLLATGAQGGTAIFGTGDLDGAVDLAAPADHRRVSSLGVDCVSLGAIDPTRPSAPLAVDRPACSAATTPVATTHEFLRVNRGDVAVQLGYASDATQGSGLLRLLTSFSRFLNLGPLAGWQFRADAQIGRAPVMFSDNLLDEKAQVHLGTKPAAGWTLHFDAIGESHGALSPGMGSNSNVEAAAALSRVFIISGLDSEQHRVDLRVAEDNSTERNAGVMQRTASASLGYAHAVPFGAVQLDLTLSHYIVGDTSGRHTDGRAEVKFARPF